jgi:hypothetical protein
MSIQRIKTSVRTRLAAAKGKYRPSIIFRNENGAIDLASIMVGVIVIGIIAGVIAATVFSVIPWSQDQAASQKLDGVKTAESVEYAQSSGSGVAQFVDFASLKSATGNASNSALIQADPNVDIYAFGATATDGTTGTHWVAVSKSQTGQHFYEEDGGAGVVKNVTDLSTAAQTAEAAAVAAATGASPWK